MEPPELGWSVLLLLFLASSLAVLDWLLQEVLWISWWRRRRKQFWSRWSGETRSEVGLKGLLRSLLSFKTLREAWLGSWVCALNQQAHEQQSSVQITFENDLKVASSSSIDSVTCISRSARRMVLQCQCRVDVVTFPVTVTQQSPVLVNMEVFHVTVSPAVLQIQINLEEMEDGGLLVTWSVLKPPSFSLRATPYGRLKQPDDIDTIQRLTEEALFTSQPALVLDLRSAGSGPGMECTDTDLCHSPTLSKKVHQLVTEDWTVDPSVQPTQRPNQSSDPVADTAIRQLTESRAKKTQPTNKSTLIISGVSKVPLPDLMVSRDYAASIKEVLQHSGSGLQTEAGQSKRVSDVDSDTGSTGVLETRSLKDNRAGFLPRGLWFRRRRGPTQSSISQSHEDVSNISGSSTSSRRKKSGSFSRRLIKRFSFRKTKASEGREGNPGKSSLEN